MAVAPERSSSKAATAGQKRAVSRLFAEMFAGHRLAYAAAIGCMVVMAASTGSLAWLMRLVVNDVLVAQNQQAMWVIAGAVLAVSVARGLADYGQTVLLTTIGNQLVAVFQQRIFDKVLKLGIAELSRSHSAKLINRLATHTNAARNVVTRMSNGYGRDLMTVVGLTAVMLVQDVRMGLVTVIVGPVVLFGLGRITRTIRELAAREQASMAGVVQSMQETVQGIRAIKSFTAEAEMRERFGAAALEVRARSDRMTRVRALTSPFMESLGGVVIAAFILYAGWQALAAGRTPGEFMAFTTAFLLSYDPLKRLAGAHVQLQRDVVGLEKMYEFLDGEEQEPEHDERPDLPRVAGRIVFASVAFGYERDRPVLNNLSMELLPGEVVALVGPSGAGKSTIAGLLQGFYRPWQGAITIDGVSTASVNLKSLRRQIAVVSQDAAMFSGTIRDNIALGRPGAGDDEILAAAEAAGAMSFVRELPLGLDTSLGERGATLSGGQVQRISIARAILKDAPILLLDEATSALDMETELRVQQALTSLMAGRATLVIAHRLSTIERADRVYLLQHGQVTQCGSHNQLLSGSEDYRRLFGHITPSSQSELSR